MGKNDNLWILAIVGVAGYGLIKSDFFKGVGEVGSGVGSAVSGAGSFVRETFVEGGELIREIGGTSQTILREGSKIVEKTGGIVGNILDTSGEAIENIGDEIIQQQERLLDIDDKIISGAKKVFSFGSLIRAPKGILSGGSIAPVGAVVSPVNLVLGGASSVVKSAAKFLKTEPVSGGAVVLPSSSGSSGARAIRDGKGRITGVEDHSIQQSRQPTGAEIILNKAVPTIPDFKRIKPVEKKPSLFKRIGSKIRGFF